ncbi:hypothetical protein GYB59_01565 [bacterium]|nr:hypothetical protein [bacterium]
MIWLLDDHGTPAFFITGLIDHRNGKLTRLQLDKWAKSLLPQITCEQPMIELTVTASATAELTFTDGFDFETSDYDAFGDERDEWIADAKVSDACGHLDGSYVSYVERDDNYLLVNAEITQPVTVQVPWRNAMRLRKDQLEYLTVLADEELYEHVLADDVRLVNVAVELEEASVRTA